jgi:hypothetical protein
METLVNAQKCPEVSAGSEHCMRSSSGRKDEADLLLLTTFGRPGLRDNVRWPARGNFANFLESRHEPIGSR